MVQTSIDSILEEKGESKDLEAVACVRQHPSITNKLLIPEIERGLAPVS